MRGQEFQSHMDQRHFPCKVENCIWHGASAIYLEKHMREKHNKLTSTSNEEIQRQTPEQVDESTVKNVSEECPTTSANAHQEQMKEKKCTNKTDNQPGFICDLCNEKCGSIFLLLHHKQFTHSKETDECQKKRRSSEEISTSPSKLPKL